MATRNISERRIQDTSLHDTVAGGGRRLRISTSSIYSAVILILVVGIAILFRGFV